MGSDFTPPKIALFGQFGVDNFGNDASLEAMLYFLRHARPDAQLTCICADPRTVTQRYSVEAIEVNLPARLSALFRVLDRLLLRVPRMIQLCAQAIRVTRQIDLLIIPGTGLLDEPGRRLDRMHWSLLLWCTAARISGKKIAFVSVGAGPVKRSAIRWLLMTATSMAHYRSYRSGNSRQCIKMAGINVEGDPVYTDLAFKLPIPADLPKRSTDNENGVSVGIGLMAHLGWYRDEVYEAYIDKFVEFTQWLAARGHRVRLLVADKGDRSAIDDFLRAVMIKDQSLLDNGSIIADHIVCTQDLMRQIARTDVVVCTRFHNIVYALKLGRPVMSVGYSKKNDAVLADAGLGKFCQMVDQLDVGLLQEQFLALLKDREMYEIRIRQATERFEELLSSQELVLSSRFLGKRG